MQVFLQNNMTKGNAKLYLFCLVIKAFEILTISRPTFTYKFLSQLFEIDNENKILCLEKYATS